MIELAVNFLTFIGALVILFPIWWGVDWLRHRKIEKERRARDHMLWDVWDKLSSEGQITMGDCIADEIYEAL